MTAVQKHKAPLYGCHHGFLFLLFFSCPQSMCEVLSPGLAVSVLKAIFQEVHVQVSNVISHYPVPAPWVSGDGLPARRTEHSQWQCSVAHPSRSSAVLLRSLETACLTAEREADSS